MLSRTQHWTNEIRSLAIDVGKGDVWIEKVKINSCEPRQDSATRRLPDGAIGELTSLFEQVMRNPAELTELRFDLTDLAKKLPAELKTLAPVDSPEWIRQVIAEAESRLLGRLLQSEAPE